MSDPAPAASGSSSEDQWRPSERQARLPRACTSRRRNRDSLSSAANAAAAAAAAEQQQQRQSRARERDECSRIVTPLLPPSPPPAQQPRWALRSMWQLASLISFLHVFRPLLNITAEFSAEELETALITPNSTLDDIHIPLLKAIPPITRMALGRATWVTVLCRKLRDWWHWVADGDLPIVASHGAEAETYRALDPGVRVLILKALCDIRVEQEDIRNYIEGSLKRGASLSVFRRERIGGNSHGISYWYEDDPDIGHRLYREIRQFEVKKVKGKAAIHSPPPVSYQWETVATNLDEFQEVSDKLLASKNRTEAALGKRLKIDILPEVEKDHKRKERLLKKQHRQALLLDSFVTADGLSSGRSLRDRKPVTYTFDDYDRSINEAIKITKKGQTSPEDVCKREGTGADIPSNGRSNGPSQVPRQVSYDAESPLSNEDEDTGGDQQEEALDRSNRRRKRPQRYPETDYVEAISDNEVVFDSDDDIVGEVVYDEEYIRSRKQKKASSSSEGDDEYRWEENAEDEEEDDEDDLSVSEDSDEDNRYRKTRTRSRRGTKLRSVDEIQLGLRRSKRSTLQRVNYRQYELSDSEGAESERLEKSDVSDRVSDAADELELSTGSKDSQHDKGSDASDEVKDQKTDHEIPENEQKEPQPSIEKSRSPSPDDQDIPKRRFLDLNELAPGTGFDDGPPSTMKDDKDYF